MGGRNNANTDVVEKFVIQGYWETADEITSASLDLYFTINTALASANGMEGTESGSLVSVLATDGQFAWQVDNNGYVACRVKYDAGSMTTLGTLLIAKSWER